MEMSTNHLPIDVKPTMSFNGKNGKFDISIQQKLVNKSFDYLTISTQLPDVLSLKPTVNVGKAHFDPIKKVFALI